MSARSSSVLLYNRLRFDRKETHSSKTPPFYAESNHPFSLYLCICLSLSSPLSENHNDRSATAVAAGEPETVLFGEEEGPPSRGGGGADHGGLGGGVLLLPLHGHESGGSGCV